MTILQLMSANEQTIYVNVEAIEMIQPGKWGKTEGSLVLVHGHEQRVLDDPDTLVNALIEHGSELIT